MSILPGCEALVSCGLMESLLKVVRWPGADDHITVCFCQVLLYSNVFVSQFLLIFPDSLCASFFGGFFIVGRGPS